MKAAEILEIESCSLIEPSLEYHLYPDHMEMLLGTEAEEARFLVDEHEEPMALALRSANNWTVGSSLFTDPPTGAMIEKFESVNGEIYQEKRSLWRGAIFEYYSLMIQEETMPAMEDVTDDRIADTKDLIGEVFGKGGGQDVLDYCCGSGVGSEAMRRLGYNPFSCDNDASLLALGLNQGRMIPDRTLWIDARTTGRFIEESLDTGICLMAGQIYPYTSGIWEEIITSLLEITARAMITTGTEEESVLVKGWCEASGKNTELFENDRDPVYDRWCCIAKD